MEAASFQFSSRELQSGTEWLVKNYIHYIDTAPTRAIGNVIKSFSFPLHEIQYTEVGARWSSKKAMLFL
jgi:hypothetical protein